MAHNEDHKENLSHDELKYREHMKRAADLCKIDLFLTARTEFRLALEYKPDDTEAAAGVAQCTANISRDRKRVLVLVPIVLAIITAVILFT
jgi:hypothetical protein